MLEDIQTNEQKLDAIYRIVQAQESRMTRARWYRLLKWIILLSIAYFIAQNPTFLIEKMTEFIMPSIMDNMKTMLGGDTFKELIPKL